MNPLDGLVPQDLQRCLDAGEHRASSRHTPAECPVLTENVGRKRSREDILKRLDAAHAAGDAVKAELETVSNALFSYDYMGELKAYEATSPVDVNRAALVLMLLSSVPLEQISRTIEQMKVAGK